VKRSKRVRRVVVSADGHGVVSHAGVGLLREMAEYTGLVEGVTDALIGTYKGVPTHAPGRVFTDLVVAAADGADAISGIGVLTDRERHRVGDDADRGVGHQPVAAHPRAVGVLLTHRPPRRPPSRVPSPGYAFPQPLTRVTIVI
jgi:hypothetical protein